MKKQQVFFVFFAHRKIYSLLLLFVFCYSFVSSQIVNVENQRLKGEEDGWSGNFDLSLSFIQNTKSIFQLGNRNRLYYKKGIHTGMLLTDMLIVKSKNEDFANSGFQHLRYAYHSQRYKFLYLEAFQQAQYNRVQLINLRLLFGGGARMKILDKDSAAINLGTFMMAEHEEEKNGIVNQIIRYSLFTSFDFQFHKHIGINSIIYYQPGVFDTNDYRLNIEASIRMKVTEKMSFNISYNLFYDNEPSETVPKTNYILKNAFSYTF